MSAQKGKSDLYLITQSNIPFKKDPIRYGGDRRESDDQFWIDLCVKHGLNYYVLEKKSELARMAEALEILDEHWNKAVNLTYDRKGL